jgi:ribonuclease HI
MAYHAHLCSRRLTPGGSTGRCGNGVENVITPETIVLTTEIVGPQAVRELCIITPYFDSRYVIKTMTQGWKRITNVDLWTRLDAAAKPHCIAWKWIWGRNGAHGGVRADAPANQAARLHMARR